MRRIAPVLALAAAALTSGCVYDPYTKGYEPCCAYYAPPPGPYAAPPPPGPYAAPPPPGPYGAPPPPGQPGPYASAPPEQPPGPPGAAPYHVHGGSLAQRFAAANVTHDGRLTREQAAAGMPRVARNFDAIDAAHKGYVTLDEVRAFLAQRRMQGPPPGAPPS